MLGARLWAGGGVPCTSMMLDAATTHGITTHDATRTRRHKHGLSEQVSSTATLSTIDSVSYTV